MVGKAPVPKWLAVDGLLSQFGSDRAEARKQYRHFVLDGIGKGIWEGLNQQIYLGDDAFVQKMQAKAQVQGDVLTVLPPERRPRALALADIVARQPDRNTAIVAAYATGAYSYWEIAEHFGIHLATAGCVVRRSMQYCGN